MVYNYDKVMDNFMKVNLRLHAVHVYRYEVTEQYRLRM